MDKGTLQYNCMVGCKAYKNFKAGGLFWLHLNILLTQPMLCTYWMKCGDPRRIYINPDFKFSAN